MEQFNPVDTRRKKEEFKNVESKEVPGTLLEKLLQEKKQLEQRLMDVDKQLYDAEDDYLKNSTTFNAHGFNFEGYLHVKLKHGERKTVTNEDRVFTHSCSRIKNGMKELPNGEIYNVSTGETRANKRRKLI